MGKIHDQHELTSGSDTDSRSVLGERRGRPRQIRVQCPGGLRKLGFVAIGRKPTLVALPERHQELALAQHALLGLARNEIDQSDADLTLPIRAAPIALTPERSPARAARRPQHLDGRQTGRERTRQSIESPLVAVEHVALLETARSHRSREGQGQRPPKCLEAGHRGKFQLRHDAQRYPEGHAGVIRRWWSLWETLGA